MAITRPLEGAQAEPKGRGNECEERAAGAALKGFPWVPKATPRVSGGVQCDFGYWTAPRLKPKPGMSQPQGALCGAGRVAQLPREVTQSDPPIRMRGEP